MQAHDTENPWKDDKVSSVSLYGERTAFTSSIKIGDAQNMSFTVMRHGVGKKRVARMISTLPRCTQNTATWAYETTQGRLSNGEVKRDPQVAPPDLLPNNATQLEQIKQARQTLLSKVWKLTRGQRGAEWFLARKFRFTSTSLFVAVNCLSAPYFRTAEEKDLHTTCKSILRLSPRKHITKANAATLDDEDLQENRAKKRKKAEKKNAGDIRLPRGDKATPQTWLSNRRKEDLRTLVSAYNIQYELTDTRETLAQKLATHFAQPVAPAAEEGPNNPVAPAAEEGPNNPDAPAAEGGPNNNATVDDAEDQEEATEEDAQIALLHRMMPRWFMTPFASKQAGPLDMGKVNESIVTSAVPKSLFELSDGKFKVGVAKQNKVEEFGLLAHRNLDTCAASPDGIFPLMMREDAKQPFRFLGHAALEVKTKGSVNTATEVENLVQQLGNKHFIECEAGTDLFQKAVPEAPYRAQLAQHATALQLEYVLMVYSVPGSRGIKLMVLVHFSEEQRNALFRLQKMLTDAYLGFAHGPSAPGEIPSLGKDYTTAYAYAGEHHTIELWLLLMHAHNRDVKEKGVPPRARRIIHLFVCIWNKFMGWVDCLRKVVKSARAPRGRDVGPGSLLWLTIFDYILYQAFRIYQASKVARITTNATSYRQLEHERHKYSYPHFLADLVDRDGIRSSHFESVYPWLPLKICHKRSQNEAYEEESSPENEEVLSPPQKKRKFTAIKRFLDPQSDMFSTRTNTEVPHLKQSFSQITGLKRGSCRLCCIKCEQVHHHQYQSARQASWVCSACHIPLCKNCFVRFHDGTTTLQIPKCKQV